MAVRNRLRHEALPLLQDITGRDPVPALLRLAEDFRAMEDLENRVLESANLLDPQGRIYLPSFRALPEPLQLTALRDYLKTLGIRAIDRPLLDRAAALADTGGPASVNLPGGARLRRGGGRLWLDRTLRLPATGPD